MSAWQDLVRQRLADLALEPHERSEVVEEIAAHLEECYEQFRKNGLPEVEAVRQALAQVNDWRALGSGIRSARTREVIMTNRVTQFWLPGLLTFVLSMGLLAVVQKYGSHPLILSLDKGTPILMLYTSWLEVLPIAGAAGAYLSKRAGGSSRMILLSSLFPVLPFGVVFMIAVPVGLVIDHNVPYHIVLRAFLSLILGWVLVPGATLFAGGLLAKFLFWRLDSLRVVSN